jgi:hypothetical protein
MNIALATISETVRALAARFGGGAMGESDMAGDDRGTDSNDLRDHG